MSHCLVVDTLNDPSIVSCADERFEDKESWTDWNLIKSYFGEIQTDYHRKLMAAARSVVTVETNGHSSLGSGIHRLPIVEFLGTPLSLQQARMLEVITPGEVGPEAESQLVSRGTSSEINFRLPREVISVTRRYDHQLLAYFFCAVRDPSPLMQFKNLYNVLEYFFEYYPKFLGVRAETERDQLAVLVAHHTSSQEFLDVARLLGPEWRSRVGQERPTSSGEPIPRLDLQQSDPRRAYSDRLYAIRCACVHSKLTRKGRSEPRLVPSTEDEDILADETNVLRWLAIKCIRAEGEIATP